MLFNQKTVDNFWLHLGVEGGVLGMAAFLAVIGTALYAPFRALRGEVGSRFAVPAGIVSAAAVLCVATVTTMLLEGNTAAFLFWFMLGSRLAEPADTAESASELTTDQHLPQRPQDDPHVEAERAALATYSRSSFTPSAKLSRPQP